MEFKLNYKAPPTAIKFHNSPAFVRGIRGPYGCLRGDEEVITINGPVPISEITEPVHVLSWNEKSNQFQFSLSGGAYPKGVDYLYRVLTKHGEFVASGHHRIFCSHSGYLRVDSLSPGQSVSLCSSSLLPTNSSFSQISSALDVQHCSQTVLDFVGHYAESARQYGLQLLLDEGIDLSSFPLQGGVRKSSQHFAPYVSLSKDGHRELRRSHSHLNNTSDLRCRQDYFAHVGRLASTEVTPSSSGSLKHSDELFLEPQQSPLSSYSHQTSEQSSEYYNSYINSLSKDTIVSIERLDVKEPYYDMQVLDTNNYVTTSGHVHHNSGKSVSMCIEIFLKLKAQAPSKDGKRRSRWLIVRNTQPQLETTTLKTWLEWFPESIFGKLNRKPPFTHFIRFDDIEAEVIFLALDRPDDSAKLGSLEATGVFFNEAKDIPYEIIAAASGRVGRYPPQIQRPDDIKAEDWPTWRGIIMDTNPPSESHWWHDMAEDDAWAIDEMGNKIDPATVEDRNKWQFWAQPSGLSPDAENIENLPGGQNYYRQQIAGKNKEWINVFVHGNYGDLHTGLSVYGANWNPDIHMQEGDLKIPPYGTIYVGVDASGRHPAAVFLYRNINTGQIVVCGEVCVTQKEGLGATNFSRLLSRELDLRFPKHDFEIWGDPAGGWKAQNDEKTYFDILGAEGLKVKASPGLRIPDRIETVIHSLNRMVAGKPALQIHHSCKTLIAGFNGAYKKKRLNVSGSSEEYDDKPHKDRYSDAQDALQYALCGMGEMKSMKGRNSHGIKPIYVKGRYGGN